MDHRTQPQNIRVQEYRKRFSAQREAAMKNISEVTKSIQSERRMIKLYEDLKLDGALSTYNEQFQGIYVNIRSNLKVVGKSEYVNNGGVFLKVVYKAEPPTYEIQKPKQLDVPQADQLMFMMNTARYWVETRPFTDMTMYMTMQNDEIPAITPSILYILTLIYLIRGKFDMNKNVKQVQLITRFTFKYAVNSKLEPYIEDVTGLSVPIANSYNSQMRSFRDLVSQYKGQIKKRKLMDSNVSVVLKNILDFVTDFDTNDRSQMVQDKFDTPIFRDFKIFMGKSQQAEEQIALVNSKLSENIQSSYYLDLVKLQKFTNLLENAHSTRNTILIETLVDSLIRTLQSAPINFNTEAVFMQFDSLPELSRVKFINMLVEKNKTRIYTMLKLVEIKRKLNYLQAQFDERSALQLIKGGIAKSYQTMLDIYGNSVSEFKLILAEAKQLQTQTKNMVRIEGKLQQYGLIMAQIQNNFNTNRIALQNTNMQIMKISQSIERFSTQMSVQLRRLAEEQSEKLTKQTIYIVSNIEKEISSINQNSIVISNFLSDIMGNMKQLRQQTLSSNRNVIQMGKQMQKGQRELKDFIIKNTQQSQGRQLALIKSFEGQHLKLLQDMQNGRLDQRIAMNQQKIGILADQTTKVNELSTFMNFGNKRIQQQIGRLQQYIEGFPTNQLTQRLKVILQTLRTQYDAQLLKQIEHIGNTLNNNKDLISNISYQFQNYFNNSIKGLMGRLDTKELTKQLQNFNQYVLNSLSKSFGSLAQQHSQMNKLYAKVKGGRQNFISTLDKEDTQILNRIKASKVQQSREIQRMDLSSEINAKKERMKAAINQIDLSSQKIQDLSLKVDNLTQKLESVVELVNGVSRGSNPTNMNQLFNDVLALAQESEIQPPFDGDMSRVYNDQKMRTSNALTNFKQTLTRIENKIDGIKMKQTIQNERQRSYDIKQRGNNREDRKMEEYMNRINRVKPQFADRSLQNIMIQNDDSYFSQQAAKNTNVQLAFEHAAMLILQFSMMAASLLNSRSDFGLQIANMIRGKVRVPQKVIREVYAMISQDFGVLTDDLKQIIEGLIKQHFPSANGQKYSEIANNRYVEGWNMGIRERSDSLEDVLRRYK